MGLLPELFNKRVVAPDGTVADGIDLRGIKKKPGPDTPLEEGPPTERPQESPGDGGGDRATPPAR